MEENKELNDFVRKSIQEAGLENPSLDFTNLVMSKINVEEEKSVVFEYKPLLSKSAWFVIISIVVSIFGYVTFGLPEKESTWIWFSELNVLTSFNVIGSIPKIPVSKTILYGIMAVTFFGCLQIVLLKKRVDNVYKTS